jgi:hypothetical protein
MWAFYWDTQSAICVLFYFNETSEEIIFEGPIYLIELKAAHVSLFVF